MSGLVHCMQRSECLKAQQRTAELLRTGVHSDNITSDKRSNLREVKFIDALRPRQRPYLKTIRGRRAQGFQARSKDQEILEEGGGAGPSLLPRRDHE